MNTNLNEVILHEDGFTINNQFIQLSPSTAATLSQLDEDTQRELAIKLAIAALRRHDVCPHCGGSFTPKQATPALAKLPFKFGSCSSCYAPLIQHDGRIYGAHGEHGFNQPFRAGVSRKYIELIGGTE